MINVSYKQLSDKLWDGMEITRKLSKAKIQSEQ